VHAVPESPFVASHEGVPMSPRHAPASPPSPASLASLVVLPSLPPPSVGLPLLLLLLLLEAPLLALVFDDEQPAPPATLAARATPAEIVVVKSKNLERSICMGGPFATK
jgi:hypothetical protein